MEFKLQTLRFNATEKLVEYVNKKVAKLEKNPDIQTVDLTLDVVKPETVNNKEAKIPNINVDWLLFGTGEMFSRDDTTAPPSSDNSESAAGNEPSLDFSPSGSNDLFGNLAHAPSRQPASSLSAGSSPSIVRQEIKYVERPQRQITEIRIYFDDLTFETFVPKK